ncbi:MAG: hypothetical protein QM569_10290 [Acidovorax sp.]|uniref:hypothetical protein n=1 Tax=Acidovorax sp. TaxID=1872122 RepID=UPI0039E2B2EA
MTTILREIYDHLPDAVQVPEHLRRQRGEVIILPLAQEDAPVRTAAGDARRQALSNAWSCVEPVHSVQAIDADLAALRGEWVGRP